MPAAIGCLVGSLGRRAYSQSCCSAWHPTACLPPRRAAQVDLVDVEGATVRSWDYTLASPLLLEGLESRQALQDWLELLAAHHPVQRYGLWAGGARHLGEGIGLRAGHSGSWRRLPGVRCLFLTATLGILASQSTTYSPAR